MRVLDINLYFHYFTFNLKKKNSFAFQNPHISGSSAIIVLMGTPPVTFSIGRFPVNCVQIWVKACYTDMV